MSELYVVRNLTKEFPAYKQGLIDSLLRKMYLSLGH